MRLLRIATQARVYPRSCGETVRSIKAVVSVSGLSPLVRGNLDHPEFAGGWNRSIPARAGKPVGGKTVAYMERVYPRSCGETAGRSSKARHTQGLSPLVRGNHRGPGGSAVIFGSIPARAGKPFTIETGTNSLRVYPRSCGETR